MTRKIAYSALLLAAACADRNVRTVGPASLAGEWRVELRPGGIGWLHQPAATAIVVLKPTATRDSAGRQVPAPGYYTGRVRLQRKGILRVPAPNERRIHGRNSAYAEVSGDSQFSILLQIVGECGDCGNIHLHGRFHGPTLRGSWYQETLSDEPGGPFEMGRVDD